TRFSRDWSSDVCSSDLHVFDLPGVAAHASGKQCWLEVGFAGGRSQQIAVAPLRLGSNANKLHINLAQDEQPLRATLHCQDNPASPAQQLAEVDFPQGLPAMPAPIIVGQEQGYSALRREELPRLQAALEALAKQSAPSLHGEARLLYDSYVEHRRRLSALPQQLVQRIETQRQHALRLNRWLDAYGARLADSPAAREALEALLQRLQLASTPLLPAAQSFTLGSGHCRSMVNG